MGILIGILTALAAVLFNIVAGSILQRTFGSLGLAMTELGFACIALISAIVYNTWKRSSLDKLHIPYPEQMYTIEQTFPFRLPRLRHMVGGLILMYGGYMITAMYYNSIMRIFPDTYTELSKSMLDTVYTGSFASVFCTVAIVPAICEELLMRGAMQHAFGELKKPIYTILLTGLMFGLFHIDPIRIPFAAAMGIILSYAYYRSGSLWVPIGMHFANNAYSAISAWSLQGIDTSQLTEQAASLGLVPWMEPIAGLIAAITLAVLSLVALFGGAAFLEPNLIFSVKKHKKPILCCVGYVLVLALGMFLSILFLGL